MPRHCVRTLVGLVGLAVVAASTALPARASDPASNRATDRATFPTHGQASVDVDSTYLAGYTTTTGAVVSARTRTFTVPSYSCGAGTTGSDPTGSVTVTKSGVLATSLHLGAGPLIGPDGTLDVPELGTIKLAKNRTDAGKPTKPGTAKIDRVEDGVTEIKTGRLRTGTFMLTAR